ncbi:G5 domain-containing protein [Herbiconiux sp. P17]|uniref:G5 domain-containing protein n=1 Tax=Herbiconiux wuyangfengii TaxID=3342794 RepID=UPI0035B94065
MSTPLPPAGWYPDPNSSARQRWWDGGRWTDFFQPAPPPLPFAPATGAAATAAPGAVTAADPSPPAVPGLVVPSAPASASWRPRMSTWIVGAVAILCGVIGIPSGGVGGFVLVVSLFVLAGGLWTLATGRRGWLNLVRARKAGGAATGLAIAALLLGTILVPHPAAAPSAAPLGVSSQLGTEAVSPASGTSGTASTPTPTPTPTPVVTVTSVEVSEPIPFGRSSYDEPTLEAGTNVVVTGGVPGTKVSTWQVTLTDGVETGRTLVSETVTVAPVDEVTAIGVAQPAPLPEVPAESAPVPDDGGGCDPNYSGACVPIASDVDCAGGSGNGPAYVQGPVYIVGGDPYDLDRDGDGIACD